MAVATIKKPLTTSRQRELLRVLEDAFTEFDKRGQTNYSLNGMTTHHVLVHATLGDFVTLKEFWPSDLVQRGSYGQTVYVLEEDTMSKIRGSVADSLNQLSDKGYVEKTGNVEERRWRLIREKPPQTKPALDPDGNRIGTFVKEPGGIWVLQS